MVTRNCRYVKREHSRQVFSAPQIHGLNPEMMPFEKQWGINLPASPEECEEHGWPLPYSEARCLMASFHGEACVQSIF
jgi:hypothetical protein